MVERNLKPGFYRYENKFFLYLREKPDKSQKDIPAFCDMIVHYSDGSLGNVYSGSILIELAVEVNPKEYLEQNQKKIDSLIQLKSWVESNLEKLAQTLPSCKPDDSPVLAEFGKGKFIDSDGSEPD